MNDLLQRAWSLLAEGERPEGMVRHPGDHFNHDDVTAYDRLCQAVEGKLLATGRFYIEGGNGEYKWFDTAHDFDVAHHTDRLTAAVMAAERKDDGVTQHG